MNHTKLSNAREFFRSREKYAPGVWHVLETPREMYCYGENVIVFALLWIKGEEKWGHDFLKMLCFGYTHNFKANVQNILCISQAWYPGFPERGDAWHVSRDDFFKYGKDWIASNPDIFREIVYRVGECVGSHSALKTYNMFVTRIEQREQQALIIYKLHKDGTGVPDVHGELLSDNIIMPDQVVYSPEGATVTCKEFDLQDRFFRYGDDLILERNIVLLVLSKVYLAHIGKL